jgi:hypothetical protein
VNFQNIKVRGSTLPVVSINLLILHVLVGAGAVHAKRFGVKNRVPAPDRLISKEAPFAANGYDGMGFQLPHQSLGRNINGATRT